MKRSALLVAAALSVVACQEVSTSPEVADASTAQDRFSNPPPPPIEGTAILTIGLQTSTLSTASLDVSLALSEACEEALPIVVSIPVKYFLNRVQNAGWIHFSSNEDVEASANGMVREQNGRDSGQGTVTINDEGCEVVVNLASIETLILGDCDEPPIIIDGIAPAAAPEDNPEQACFFAEFDDVTADGEPVPGGATLFGNLGQGEDNPEID